MEKSNPSKVAGNAFSFSKARAGGILWFCLAAISTCAQTTFPALNLAVSNGTAMVYWTNSAPTYLLQSTASLSGPNSWTNLASADPSVILNTFPATSGYAGLLTNMAGSNFFFTAAAGSQQFFRLSVPPPIPLSYFNIFYNGTMEFSQCPALVPNGRVHANGPIYVGTSASLEFIQTVTTTSTISSPAADGLGPWTTNNWNTYFDANPGSITNCTALLLPVGTNNPHVLIEVPPAGESPISSLGQQRFYNQAQMVLIVTNNIGLGTDPTVLLTIQGSFNGAVPGSDPSPTVLVYSNASPDFLRTNLPFLSLTNLTYDQRQEKTNVITQIDVGAFAGWLATNASIQAEISAAGGQYPAILYVADRRYFLADMLPSVRLVNGAQLPANYGIGFTVATMNPLYVMGNYNIQLANGGNQSLGTTDTTYTVPAALMSDSLTLLSPNWKDSQGFLTYNSISTAFDAVTMTVNAAILTGTVASTGSSGTNFSGGVHNLPSLLENWTGQNLWLNTSIVRLWDSNMATNQFRNPYGFNPAPVNPYYNPPTRHFDFDTRFLNPAKTPPGIPLVFYN